MKRTVPYLLLFLVAAAAGFLVSSLPNPGQHHTTSPVLPSAAEQQAEPVARPAMPIPVTPAAEGTDAGRITQPAPQVVPIPGGVTPVPEAPRPVGSLSQVEPGPVCLAGCTQPPLG